MTYFFELKVEQRTLTFAQDAASRDEASTRLAKRLYKDHFADLARGRVSSITFVGEL